MSWAPSHGERCPWCGSGVRALPVNLGPAACDNVQPGVEVSCPRRCMGAGAFVAVGDPDDPAQAAMAARKGFLVWSRGR